MKKLIFVILLSVFLTSCWEKEKEQEIKKYYKTTEVWSGIVLDASSYIWYTDSFNSIILSSKIWWKVNKIYSQVWDKVKSWQLVAELDWNEAKTGYSSSNDIITSLEVLKLSTSGTFDSQILASEEKLKQIQTQIEIADIWISGTTTWLWDTKNTIFEQLKTIETQIDMAQTSMETAKLNLENTTNTLNQKKIDIYNNSKNAIANANILWTNIIDFLDNFYWISDSNKSKNDDFEIYIWAKNSSLKNDIENKLRELIKKYENIKNMSLDSDEDIENSLREYNEFFTNDFRKILSLNYKVLENSISTSNFTQSTINNYKTQTTTFQSQLEQTILTTSGQYFLWLKWSIDNISNLKKESKSNLDMLQKQIDLAWKQIDTLNQTYIQYSSQSTWQITDVKTKKDISEKQKELALNQMQEAKAQIESLKKQKETSLASIDTQINQVKSWKNDASVMIENSKILSPINWIIVEKISEVWQIVSAWMPILVVSNNKIIKIEISIDDETKKYIKFWDEVKVEIEWIKELKKWIVSKILPTKDNITKKTWIEISIKNENESIKLWSYSKVYFNLKQDNYWIIIPNKAIVSQFMIPGVYVLTWWKAEFKNIEILKQNDDFSQINGLNYADIIITDWKENIYDWEILE